MAAGVLGTLELLYRCRDEARTLPALSPVLGQVVRTNSEAVVGILSNDAKADLTHGPTVSSHFYPDEITHTTQNRLPQSYTFMKWYSGPLVDGDHPGRRALKVLAECLRHPLRSTASLRARDWFGGATLLTVMQNLDNQLAFRYGRGLFTLYGKGLQSNPTSGRSAPTYLPAANRAATEYAHHSQGIPLNSLLESMLNNSVTAHILGGCPIGKDPSSGVVDSNHQVFGYLGLSIADTSVIPVNMGVNPSLTITALVERFMSLIPPANQR